MVVYDNSAGELPSNPVDDLVGLSEKTASMQVLRQESASLRKIYGIAAVPDIERVISLYTKACDIIQRAPQLLEDVREGDLETLREDSESSKNYAIRKSSRQVYEGLLKELSRSMFCGCA